MRFGRACMGFYIVLRRLVFVDSKWDANGRTLNFFALCIMSILKSLHFWGLVVEEERIRKVIEG